MRITRPWPFHGRVFQLGQVHDFPEETCERMRSANPPYGEDVEPEASEPEKMSDGAYSLHLFTHAALKLLKEYKLDFDEYEGGDTGAGGKVTKSDVEAWLAESEE
jgi:pyruvate/2-oxoglutarate dehydrogenase complex dihydrolipoamide acyltransferase (E2) component